MKNLVPLHFEKRFNTRKYGKRERQYPLESAQQPRLYQRRLQTLYGSFQAYLQILMVGSPHLCPVLQREWRPDDYDTQTDAYHGSYHSHYGMSVCILWLQCAQAAHIFVRTIKCWLWVLMIYILVAAIMVGISYMAIKFLQLYTAIGAISLAGLVILCLLLPLTYITMRYILNDGMGFWKQFKIGYGVGMRRWGFIFIVVLVACIVELLLLMLLSLPATILSIANTQSMFGVAMGDPYALPSYMPALAAGTFLIIGFLQAYVMLSVLFPIYYMYGSIDAQEQEKQDFNKQQQ